MKLYSFFNSSASFRVRIALALKAISYEFVGVNIRADEQWDEHYLSTVSPSPLVPVLKDGERCISQSMAILDYLDEVAPAPRLIPKDVEARAKELAFANILACDMHPLNNLRILKYLKQELSLDDKAVQAWYQHWLDVGMQSLERILEKENKGAKFCFGNQASLADCVLIPQIANALRKKCDVSAFPKSMAIYEYAMSQEAFKKAAPEAQPDYVFP